MGGPVGVPLSHAGYLEVHGINIWATRRQRSSGLQAPLAVTAAVGNLPLDIKVLILPSTGQKVIVELGDLP